MRRCIGTEFGQGIFPRHLAICQEMNAIGANGQRPVLLGSDQHKADPLVLRQTRDYVWKGFVDLLVQGNYSEAVKKFDATMKEAMPADKLEEAWNSLITQVGSFKKQTGVRQAKEQWDDVGLVTCEFEKATLDIKVVYNSYQQISGLWFVPSQ